MVEGHGVEITGKAGTVGATNTWKTVSLHSAEFANLPIVIMGPPTYNDADPVTVRLSGIATGRFRVKLQEWDYQDGSHAQENVNFLALEPGVYNFPDGSVAEVGSVSAFGGKANLSTYTFAADFPSVPEVLTTIQTDNDSVAVTARVKSITNELFKVSLHEEDAASGGHAQETIGFVAFYSAGSVSPVLNIGGVKYTAEFVRNELDHNWAEILDKDFLLEEEGSIDTEVSHAKEFVSVLKLMKGNQSLHFAQDVSSKGRDTVVIRKR
jgi:hypothetical protein